MALELHRNKASLLVTPFRNVGNPSQAPDYFSRGFVDDLVTDLARFQDLLVITSEADSDALAADFLLKGTICRTPPLLRVTTQLIERSSGGVLWAQKYNQQAEDIFEIQEQIGSQVAASVSKHIQHNLLTAARRKPRADLASYDLWLQGMDSLKQGTQRADAEARGLFQRALESEPHFARAYLGLSLSYFNEWSCQLWERWDENERQAFSYAQHAAALDDNDHYAQMVLGRVYLFRREFNLAEQHLERSLALNGNDADCLVQLTMSWALLGRAEEAQRLFERARQVNPLHPNWYYAYGLQALFCDERYTELLQYAGKVPLDIMVDLPAYMAVAFHKLGKRKDAKHHLDLFLSQFEQKIAKGRNPAPGEALRWLAHVNPYKHKEHSALLVETISAIAQGSATPSPPLQPAPKFCAFQRQGSLWQLSYHGQDAWLPHKKGMADIAALLAQPNHPISAAELMGAVDVSSDQDVIDERALSEYKAHLRSLEHELEQAQAQHDLGRATALQTQREELIAHLEQAVGLRGKVRKLDAPRERARSAVTQRIKAALNAIAESHPELAKHLREALRTGGQCIYSPNITISWEL